MTQQISLVPNEMLSLIPKFSGEPQLLNLFINKAEYVLSAYAQQQDNPHQTQYVFHAISSRLIDKAAHLLSERQDVNTWSSLKDLLILHFGDPRSEECIAIELESMKIKSGESYHDFCCRIQQVRSTLFAKVNLLQDEGVKAAKMIIYNNTCLNVFMYNLPENLIRTVRLKGSNTLENALSVVTEEVNFQFQYDAKNKNKTQPAQVSQTPFTRTAQNFRFIPSGAGFGPFPQQSRNPFIQQFQPNKFGFTPKPQFGYRPPNQNQGFRFGIPNQNNFKFGIPNNQNFKFGIPNQQNFRFGIPNQNARFNFPMNHPWYRQNFNNPQQNITSECTDIKVQTEHIKNITIQKFRQLIPSVRQKRGLLNPIGSLIKVLTGNLDNEDAIRYDSQISKLQQQQHSVSMKIALITEIMGSVANVTNATKNNFIQLDKEIHDLKILLNESIQTSQSINKVIHVYSLFLHNFQMLYIKLDEIETAVAFSKVGTLHQSIIDTDEFMTVLRKIELTDKLVYPVELNNLIRIEQCVELKAFSKENQITFIIEVPLVRSESYHYYRVLSLPVTDNLNLTTLIIPKYPYLIVNQSKALSLSHSCLEIERSIFMCHEDSIVPPTMEDVCITDLLKFVINTTMCSPIHVDITKFKLQPIESNRWIFYCKTATLMTSQCGEDVTRTYVEGTYILTIEDACEITIQNVTLKQHRSKAGNVLYEKLPIIDLPSLSTSKPVVSKKPLNLDEIDLQTLQSLSHVLKNSESELVSEVSTYGSVVNARNISIGTLLLYVIIILSIFIYSFKRFKNFILSDRNHQRAENHPSDNSNLMEGGVMYSGPTAGTVRVPT
uniref:Envelope fusion protein n=2 Tax=Pectinophora gossypiella TaxID=13191 RepID=A0A1E1WG39_PECGO